MRGQKKKDSAAVRHCHTKRMRKFCEWIKDLPKTHPDLPLVISIVALLLVAVRIFLVDILQLVQLPK